MNTTPELITELKDDEVFVFGSNLSGHHGAGAAKTAMKWGAKYGQAFGPQGKTFAIPTMNANHSNKLSVEKIGTYVERFMQYAANHPEKKFLVSAVGCGLAGHSHKDIAKLFWGCDKISNIYLPEKFWKVLSHGAVAQ
jgi:hypothetical protein